MAPLPTLRQESYAAAAVSVNWFKRRLDSGSLSAVGSRRIVLAATKTALTHEESSAVQSLAALKLCAMNSVQFTVGSTVRNRYFRAVNWLSEACDPLVVLLYEEESSFCTPA